MHINILIWNDGENKCDFEIKQVLKDFGVILIDEPVNKFTPSPFA